MMRASPLLPIGALTLLAVIFWPACIPRQHAVTLPTGPPPAGSWSPFKRPFDLVWRTDTQMDANGLPLNPVWAYQGYYPAQKPSFDATCAHAFALDSTVRPKKLA